MKIDDLQKQRRELQQQMNIAEREKKIAIVTEDDSKIESASIKYEKLLLEIEKIDREIKAIKEEMRVRVEAAKTELQEKTHLREVCVASMEELKKEFMHIGDEKTLSKIETTYGEIKKLDGEIKELESIIALGGMYEAVDDETEFSSDMFEKRETAIDKFIREKLEEGKTDEEIVNELNSLNPTDLDEFVASPGFKYINDLYLGLHYVDSKGEVVAPNVKPLSHLDRSIIKKFYPIDPEISASILGEYSDFISKQLSVIDKCFEEEKILDEKYPMTGRNRDPEYYSEYFPLNDRAKEAERLITNAICAIVLKNYKKYIGDRVVNRHGADFTEWAESQEDYLRDETADFMLEVFREKARPVVASKAEIKDIGQVGQITLEQFRKYLIRAGIRGNVVVSDMFADPIEESKSSMFDDPVEEQKSSMFDDPEVEMQNSGMFDDPAKESQSSMFDDPRDTDDIGFRK